MTITVVKKIFKSGGSKAIHLPKEFAPKIGEEVIVVCDGKRVFLKVEKNLDTIESEKEFSTFVKALVEDSLKNPEKLDDLSKVWDTEWDDLLDGVDGGEDE